MTRTTPQDAVPAHVRHGRRVLAAACGIALAVVPAHAAQARLGDLDPSFDGDGIALPDVGGPATFEGLTTRPDGRPLAVGDALLVQLTLAGALDPTFGKEGVVRIPQVDIFTRLHDVRVDASGQVLAAGDQRRGQFGIPAPSLLRFTAVGAENGAVALGVAGEAHAVVPLASGHVLVAGWRALASTAPGEFFVAKLDEKGGPDPSFGAQGVAETKFGAESHAMAMAVAPDGDIVLGGSTAVAGLRQPALARFDARGRPDVTFGTGGQLVLADAKAGGELRAVAVDAAGRIVAGGVSGADAFVTRRLDNGSPDPDFGSNGATYGAPLGIAELYGLTLDGDRTVVAGRAGKQLLLLGSLDAGGTPEPALGGDPPGWRSFPEPAQAIAYGVAPGPAGTVYTAGAASTFPFVTRHLPNAAPSAALAAPAQVEEGAPVMFDAAGSRDPEGEPLRYAFDLDGDGSYEFDAGQNPLALRSFATPGTYIVGVEARDPRGAVATATRGIVVTAAPAVLGQPPMQPELPAQPEPPAQPVLGKQGVAVPVSGIVRYRLPGTSEFLVLDGTTAIPNGAEIDAREGRLLLTVLHDASGRLDGAEFYSGQFIFNQGGGAVPITTLTLSGGSFRACGAGAQRRARAVLAVAASGRAAQSNKPVRKLWGDGRGRFRTKGRYGAATVRGTRWLTADLCDGTKVRVVRGKVSVADLVRAGRKPRIVRAGQTIIVPKRGG